MEVWSRDGKEHRLISTYSLPDNAWQYELWCLEQTAGPALAVVIPDATPYDGPFTPKPAHEAFVHVLGGKLPWKALDRLLEVVESSGKIVDDRVPPVAHDDLRRSQLVWQHDEREFEIHSFHFGDEGSWCYELCSDNPDRRRNDYVAVLIPDTHPESGPFGPMPAAHVTFTIHGEWQIPWPIFRRFIDLIVANGDIVESG